MSEAIPAAEQLQKAVADHIVVTPRVVADDGSEYVHKDLYQVVKPWEAAEHIPPIKGDEAFGDPGSFAAFLKKYADKSALITWNSKGVSACLDYHYIDADDVVVGNYAQWHASLPFVLTLQWKAWFNFANNHGWPQQKAVEFLEDHALDILEPDQGVLLTLLRNLRGTANAAAETVLRPDGTAAVKFASDRTVRGASSDIELPAEITIGIPVLRGLPGAPFKLVLKLRVNVDASAHLELRLAMPQAEEVLEQVYAEMVSIVKAELNGDTNDPEFLVLRAAD